MPLTSLEQVNDEVQHTWNHYTVSPTCASTPVLAHTSSRWLSKQVWAGYKKIFFFLKKALNQPDEYATFTGTNLQRAPCVITKMEPTDSETWTARQLNCMKLPTHKWQLYSCEHRCDTELITVPSLASNSLWKFNLFELWACVQLTFQIVTIKLEWVRCWCKKINMSVFTWG